MPRLPTCLALILAPVLLHAANGGWPGDGPRESPAAGCDAFAAAGVAGTFVLHNVRARELKTCDPERAARRLLPASTFKVVNALNALENDIVADQHEVFEWDGVRRPIEAWNRDTDLAAGMRNSAVWVYQEIARRTGEERMRAFVDRLAYGNRDIDGGIDRFWLDGALRISAYEQVAFLDRLRRGDLPVSARSRRIVTEILELDRGPGWILRAKTGAAVPMDRLDAQAAGRDVDETGWLVGWIEREDGRDAVFALNIALRDMDDLALRRPLVDSLLRANGVLPVPASDRAAAD